MDKVRPYYFSTSHFMFSLNNKLHKVRLCSKLITHPFEQNLLAKRSLQEWVQSEKAIVQHDLDLFNQEVRMSTSENPLAFWDKQDWQIELPTLPIYAPTKASHPGMSLEDTKLCKQEIQELLQKGPIEPSHSNWACTAFYVNKHSEQKREKKRLVINYKPLNQFLIPKKYPIPLINDLLCRIAKAKIFSKFDLKSGF